TKGIFDNQTLTFANSSFTLGIFDLFLHVLDSDTGAWQWTRILETPLFRVRNKQETIYCYDETEKQNAIHKLGGKPEITRFKGLGEISPVEFERFINEDIRLQPVLLEKGEHIQQLLEYYMGKNTPQRQEFIIDNLKVELDIVETVV
ncbi:MAG TPA: hypothetical protein PKG56_05090, partial [Chitinophagaceae bacterium]|nr:hypothetical protein [Chitinophagaceae bacterium]